jgi:hypothetical protein
MPHSWPTIALRLHFVLEALERLELAFVDDDVVADQADACATLDLAFGDTATGHLADLGDVEHLEDLGIAEEGLATFRRQHARHRALSRHPPDRR